MEATFPLFFAAVVGFSHAFEADHLVAVSNIVTKRDKIKLAIKDGIYWGLGHTSTIFLIGLLMIVGKVTVFNGYFGYFEAVVGADARHFRHPSALPAFQYQPKLPAALGS
jgi:high-affinity nickel permease